jgi:hypothetical protein
VYRQIFFFCHFLFFLPLTYSHIFCCKTSFHSTQTKGSGLTLHLFFSNFCLHSESN